MNKSVLSFGVDLTRAGSDVPRNYKKVNTEFKESMSLAVFIKLFIILSDLLFTCNSQQKLSSELLSSESDE